MLSLFLIVVCDVLRQGGGWGEFLWFWVDSRGKWLYPTKFELFCAR